jgi:hypothetical protein
MRRWIVFLACSTAALAEPFPILKCNEWNGLTRESRLTYVLGLRDGMVALGKDLTIMVKPSSEPFSQYNQYFVSGIPFGEVEKGVSEICARPENAKIEAVYAAAAFAIKAGGGKPETVGGYLRILRKNASR